MTNPPNEERKLEIVFYCAIWPDMGGERDVIYCPKEWSRRKVLNEFKRRNKGWDFKKAQPMIYLYTSKTYWPAPKTTHHD